MIKTVYPYSEVFLQELLADFGWDFEGMVNGGGYHPVTTGNCRHDNKEIYTPHIAGNLETGVYQNAAASCRHCYPGSNPAMLVWSQGGNEIALYADKNSTKPERMVKYGREPIPAEKEECKNEEIPDVGCHVQIRI